MVLDENTIVTNYHVISFIDHDERERFNNVEIRFYNSELYESVLLENYDEAKDIAFLNYNGKHEHLKFETDNKITNSQKCYSIGNFMNYGLSYKEGYISLSEISLMYNDVYSDYIQCSISIGPGDSGAPLFNKDNKVIGMIHLEQKG